MVAPAVAVIVTRLVPGVVPGVVDGVEPPPQAPNPRAIVTPRIAMPSRRLDVDSPLRRLERPRSAPSPGKTSA